MIVPVMSKLRTILLFMFSFSLIEVGSTAQVALTPQTLDAFRTFSGWSGQRTFGWQFSSSSVIEINSLGLYDDLGDGFNRSHEVGLWDVSSGMLLASVLFDGTEAGILSNGYRYISLEAPLEIRVGRYLLGSLGGGDSDGWPADSRESTLGEGLVYEGTWLSPNDDIFEKPFIRVIGATGPFDGSNFQYTIIPEPSAMTLLIFVLMGICGVRCRRAG